MRNAGTFRVLSKDVIYDKRLQTFSLIRARDIAAFSRNAGKRERTTCQVYRRFGDRDRALVVATCHGKPDASAEAKWQAIFVRAASQQAGLHGGGRNQARNSGVAASNGGAESGYFWKSRHGGS